MTLKLSYTLCFLLFCCLSTGLKQPSHNPSLDILVTYVIAQPTKTPSQFREEGSFWFGSVRVGNWGNEWFPGPVSPLTQGRAAVGDATWCWFYLQREKRGGGWGTLPESSPRGFHRQCTPTLSAHESGTCTGGIQGSSWSWMGFVVLSCQRLGFGISLCWNTDTSGTMFCFQILTDKGKYPPLTLWNGKRPTVAFSC